jgi:hypothetical protein
MPRTYTKYSSIDDKMEYFYYYTLGIKYGIGCTSNIASFEIRDGDITREEELALAKKYDLEFLDRFTNDLYNYVSLPINEYPVASKKFESPIFNKEYFINLHDRFRSPHFCKKKDNKWELRYACWSETEKSNFLSTDQTSSAKQWQGNA